MIVKINIEEENVVVAYASQKEMRKWSMRRILRYVVASSESIMEGMAILVAFVLNSLVIMLYDPHHAFAEHNPCAVVEKRIIKLIWKVTKQSLVG